MSWFSIFKKIRDTNGLLSDEERALIEDMARDEVEAIFAASDNSPRHRAPHRAPTLAQGTRRASVLAFRDWRALPDAARELGFDENKLDRLIDLQNLARVAYPYAPDLVHVRQIAYWLEHTQVLDVDPSVFEGWERQIDLTRVLNLPSNALTRMANRGEIATYKPSERLVLHNEREVRHALAQKES